MPRNELVQSVLRALDVLESAGASEQGLSLRDLSARLGLKATTVHNLARTLLARGYLRKRSRPPRYLLGSRMGELADTGYGNGLHRRAADVLLRLAGAFPQATLTFAEPGEHQVCQRLRVSPVRPAVVEKYRNREMHPYGSASALVFQAFWPVEEVAAFRRRYPFWEYGAHLWMSLRRLEAALARVRREGCAAPVLKVLETLPVSAPVFAPGGELLAAVGASIPAEGVSARVRKSLVAAVTAGGRELSAPEFTGPPVG